MSTREEYVHRRLMELACIADSRELDSVEKEEEKRLIEELKKFAEER
jgi:hypothetical protein